MKKFNHYRMLQWLVFMPLILPLCVGYGVVAGIGLAFERVVKQIKMDVIL